MKADAKPAEIDAAGSGGAGRVVTPSAPAVRFGIAWRLSLAFLGVGALSVVACIVGWLSYARLSDNLASINDVHLPSVALSARLAEQGGAIIATAPVLALARTSEEYEEAKKGLDGRLAAMRVVLGEIAAARPGWLPEANLAVNVDAIARNLASLDAAVRERLALERRNREMVAQLRWLHADLIEEVEPLIEDSRFAIRTMLAAAERPGAAAAAEPQDMERLRQEIRKTEAMTALNAQANLAVGLVNRVATLTTLEDLAQTMHFLSEVADTIEPQLTALATFSDAVTLRQVLRRLIELSSIEGGVPGIRRGEIIAANESRRLLAQNRDLVSSLDGAIAAYVRDANVAAARAADQSAAAIAVGRNVLLAVAAISVLAALLVGVLYVQRNLVSRIVTLAGTARALEAGDLHAPIPLGGQDELADMAHALKRFRDTREELVQAAKLAALGGLAAGVGHELNQPLAAIRSHAHNGRLLIERGRTEEAETAFARIQALTARMADLVAHLKRFARKPDGTSAPVPLRATIDSALALFGSRFADEDVDLSIDVEPDLQVLAEEVRLEQIFVNLISNALDAMRGRPARRLSVGAARMGSEVAIEVSDTGAGIPDEHLAAIFDPFFTTKPVGAGLGLGLSMSYNIARDFGGRLRLGRTGAEGTAFILELKTADA